MPDLLLDIGRRHKIGPAAAALVYAAVAVVFTWPLAAGLARDIPSDLGDPLLNAWILAWDADRLLRFFSGDLAALTGFWNANIFHPEPLTLAYSEHLIAQAVQVLPVYALTGNIILAYNLLFLSTFVLSGLGMFLLVRQLTGSPRAALAAGLVYAFAPYRVPQFSHVQVISSQWMPFVLYGLRRYFDAISAPVPRPGTAIRRPSRALAGAGAALVAQNLSNGYFLLFFAPFVVAYALFEIASRQLWKNVRMWLALTATALAVAALTLPFLVPYLTLRDLGVGMRSLNEVKTFSADVFSYAMSPPQSRLWGGVLRGYEKAEGELFPTLAALLLAAIGLVSSLAPAWTRARCTPASSSPRLTPVVYVLVSAGALAGACLVLVLSGNGFTQLGPLPVRVRTLWPAFRVLAASIALLLVVSPRARAFARSWTREAVAFAVLAAAAAFLLSLGPEIRADGRLIAEAGPYSLLYWNVPGFDGLRVPARYAMLFLLFLAATAGFGASALERRYRFGGAAALAIAAFGVFEGYAAPINLNGTVEESRYATPPARVYPAQEAPQVYRFLETLPSSETVLVEFPFGEWAYELRYVFYSTVHWHKLLNGYSGNFPVSYNMNATHLRRPLDGPDAAWDSLMKAGATHAIVHSKYYRDDEGANIARWLVQHGATQLADFDGDRVFVLR